MGKDPGRATIPVSTALSAASSRSLTSIAHASTRALSCMHATTSRLGTRQVGDLDLKSQDGIDVGRGRWGIVRSERGFLPRADSRPAGKLAWTLQVSTSGPPQGAEEINIIMQ